MLTQYEYLVSSWPEIPSDAQMRIADTTKNHRYLAGNPGLAPHVWEYIWNRSIDEIGTTAYFRGTDYALDTLDALLLRPLTPAQRRSVLTFDWVGNNIDGVASPFMKFLRATTLTPPELALIKGRALGFAVTRHLIDYYQEDKKFQRALFDATTGPLKVYVAAPLDQKIVSDEEVLGALHEVYKKRTVEYSAYTNSALEEVFARRPYLKARAQRDERFQGPKWDWIFHVSQKELVRYVSPNSWETLQLRAPPDPSPCTQRVAGVLGTSVPAWLAFIDCVENSKEYDHIESVLATSSALLSSREYYRPPSGGR